MPLRLILCLLQLHTLYLVVTYPMLGALPTKTNAEFRSQRFSEYHHAIFLPACIWRYSDLTKEESNNATCDSPQKGCMESYLQIYNPLRQPGVDVVSFCLVKQFSSVDHLVRQTKSRARMLPDNVPG